jgi:hypothetical protein
MFPKPPFLKPPMLTPLLIFSLVLFLPLGLSSCMTTLLTGQVAKEMTAEQIKAYKESGQDVYGCFQIGGPPPAGNTLWLVVPKGVVVNSQFGDNCHLISR